MKSTANLKETVSVLLWSGWVRFRAQCERDVEIVETDARDSGSFEEWLRKSAEIIAERERRGC